MRAASEISAIMEAVHADGMLLVGLWFSRRSRLARALSQLAWDVEVIEQLALALGSCVALDERHLVREGRELIARLDRLLASERVAATGLLASPRLVTRLGAIWLVLETRLTPDERSMLTTLRERLTRAAHVREIDLRELTV